MYSAQMYLSNSKSLLPLLQENLGRSM